MTKVLCVGVAVADFVFYMDEFPQGAEKHRAHDAAIVGGGCAANAAVAVARLGGQAVLSARIGEDPVGTMVKADLIGEGVDCSCVTSLDASKSGFSAVMIDARGERQIVNFRGAVLPDTPLEAPADLNAVLVDTRWPSGAIAGLEHARALGVPGIVDAEAPIEGAILARASHVAFSAQGLRSLIGTGTLGDALLEMAKGLGCWAAVTDGENGVYFTDGSFVDHMPAFDVEVVDSLGAGDIWHGAFALALGEGQAEVDAVRFASAVAAIKCTRPGGREGSPTREEVNEFLKGRGQ